MNILGWLWFGVIQLFMLLFMLLGLLILVPFCLARAWRPKTTSEGRVIDVWSWPPLNLIYGNPEDGVSGACALIWLNGDTQGPYLPNATPAWRAYKWSALRNSADNLKYVFAWKNGPFKQFGKHKIGWQGGLPVLS